MFAVYEFITTRNEKLLLMMNKYTYWQAQPTKNYRTYYCSKQSSGCKAKIKLNNYGTVIKADESHTHLPPKYIKTASGYMKV
ncbi:Modifier of mdg4 [Operophtera brumata]|uniref:Modifier of mdg4 n=1 Tax=Operophtera brumata TaxID=104452 RepID=A0A0L7L9W6_OPEBR|nr:Modifier of mdg4 [Operophtera brumata]